LLPGATFLIKSVQRGPLKTIASLGLPAPLTANPPNSSTPPAQVTAKIYKGDAVHITWTDASARAVGYRVERRMGEGKWQVKLCISFGLIHEFSRPNSLVRIFFAPLVDEALTNQIMTGMQKSEVEAILGAPHERWRNVHGEHWAYYVHGRSMFFFSFRIDFDEQGAVAWHYMR
jgi:hypothetical protein